MSPAAHVPPGLQQVGAFGNHATEQQASAAAVTPVFPPPAPVLSPSPSHAVYLSPVQGPQQGLQYHNGGRGLGGGAGRGGHLLAGGRGGTGIGGGPGVSGVNGGGGSSVFLGTRAAQLAAQVSRQARETQYGKGSKRPATTRDH